MSLVLQIALGIVLAVVILAYWREILALGAGLVLLALVLGALGVGVFWFIDKKTWFSEHEEEVFVWLVTTSVISFLAFGLNWLWETATKRRPKTPDSQPKEPGYDEDRSEQ